MSILEQKNREHTLSDAIFTSALILAEVGVLSWVVTDVLASIIGG